LQRALLLETAAEIGYSKDLLLLEIVAGSGYQKDLLRADGFQVVLLRL